jgi:tetratricopeptide (TPR) repeat protein
VLYLLKDISLETRTWQWLSYVVTGVGLTSLIPWVLVNASAESSLRRFEDLLLLDEQHLGQGFVAYGYESVRKYYYNTKQPHQELQTLKTMLRFGDNYWLFDRWNRVFTNMPNPTPREWQFTDTILTRLETDLLVRISNTGSDSVNDDGQRSLTSYAKKLQFYYSADANEQRIAALYTNFLQFYFVQGRGDAAYKRVQHFVSRHPQLPQSDEFYGVCFLMSSGEGKIENSARGTDSALLYLQRAATKDTTRASAFYFLGLAFQDSKRFQEAEQAYLKCIQREPSYREALYNLVALYANDLNNKHKAIEMCLRYLKVDNASEQAKEIQQTLMALQR